MTESRSMAWLLVLGIAAVWLGVAYLGGSYFLAVGAVVWLGFAILWIAGRPS